MTMLLHQVRTDVRHIRWPLAAWLGLVAVETGMQLLRVDARVSSLYDANRLLSLESFLGYAIALLSWVLAARIVHADPPEGTTAFWLTRPVGAPTLVAAKLATVLPLFVVLPAVASSTVAATTGMPAGVLLQLFVEAALVNLAFLAPAMLLAALTRDLARLVLLAVVGSIAWASLHALTNAVAEGLDVLGDRSVLYSGLLVGGVISGVACLLVLGHQYRTRRTLRSCLLAAGGLAAAALVAAAWPWDLAAPRHPQPTALPDTAHIRVSVDNIAVRRGAPLAEERYLYGDWQLEGVPAGWLVVPFGVSASLRFDDGKTLRFADTQVLPPGGYEAGIVLGMSGSGLEAIAKVTGGRWLNNPWGTLPPAAGGAGGPVNSVTLFALPRDVLSSRAGSAGRYDGEFTCEALRASVGAAVPVAPGALARVAGFETEVMSVERPPRAAGGDRIEMAVRATAPRLLVPRVLPGVVYVLWNETRGEMLLGFPRRREMRPVATGPLQIRHDTVIFPAAPRQALTVGDDWLAGARLLVIRLDPEATFTKSVRVADFELPAEGRGVPTS